MYQGNKKWEETNNKNKADATEETTKRPRPKEQTEMEQYLNRYCDTPRERKRKHKETTRRIQNHENVHCQQQREEEEGKISQDEAAEEQQQ